jgi:NADPH:quinone reductase
MTTVTVTDTFDHPADKVWPLVSDFGGIHKYMRGMPETKVTGSGLGQDRIIALPAGEVVERLTWLDDANYAFSYTILTAPLPFERYVATVKLTPRGDSCDIEWQGNFDVVGVPEDEGKAMAHGIYSGGIKGYKKALEG